MSYKKRIVPDKVKKDPTSEKKFTVQAAVPDEEDVVLVFLTPEDAKKARKIEKLSIAELPASENGFASIIWINNFWLKNAEDKYLNGVAYKVQLAARPGRTLVYHDGTSVKAYSGTVTDIGDGRIEIELSVGDPAIGWGGGG